MFSKLFLLMVPVVNAAKGWKTVQVYVGNETDDEHSPFVPKTGVHYSQNGQDKTVIALTGGIPGFFLDLAANRALYLSNTAAL